MEINRSNEKNSTNILILTNIDDQEKILSSLTETIQLNFNEQQSSITPVRFLLEKIFYYLRFLDDQTTKSGFNLCGLWWFCNGL